MGPADFRRLIDAHFAASDPAAKAELDAEIRRRWERPRAVLISDMSGFSRITKDVGVLHFLGLIRRMHAICVPVIQAHGGHLVKAVADNLYARFEDARSASSAGFAMHEACARACANLGPNDTVEIAIGVAQGSLLDLDGEDFFGDPVNIASKLGEDIGEGGDLLVTVDAAVDVVAPEGWHASTRHARISDVDIDYVAFARA